MTNIRFFLIQSLVLLLLSTPLFAEEPRFQLVSADVSFSNKSQIESMLFKIDTRTGKVWYLERNEYTVKLSNGMESTYLVEGWQSVPDHYSVEMGEYQKFLEKIK